MYRSAGADDCFGNGTIYQYLAPLVPGIRADGDPEECAAPLERMLYRDGPFY